VFLNLILRIGIGKRVELDLDQGDKIADKVFKFLEEWGGHWAALPHVVKKASGAATECLEALMPCVEGDGPLKLIVSFDEFNLDLLVRYQGRVLPLTKTRPDPESLFEEDGELLLAGYMAGQLSDKIESGSDAKGSYVKLHFDH
jgi:NCS2 family nucleobase:cation symporter-2